MFALILRRRPRLLPKDRTFVGPQFVAPQITVFVKSISSSNDVYCDESKRSLTVSYLINSCGLSSEKAITVSKKLRIKSPENPDAVLELLRKYGFTDVHIPKLVAGRPTVLVSSPEKTLLPKLDFFCSIGVPLPVLARNLSLIPEILHLSLKNSLIPSYDYLKSFVRSDKRVVYAFSCAPRVFAQGWQREIPANVAILRELGVPESSIASLLAHSPSLLLSGKEKFAGCVDRVVEMGFDKSMTVFIHAVQVFGQMSESTLKRKMDIYRRCGWSESDITTAFLKFPNCLKLSEKKITAAMDFLVNKLGLNPVAVAQYPLLLCYSLHKRIEPRCLVVGVLNAKGLLKKTMNVATLFTMCEEMFLKRYIVDYQDYIPQLLDIYQGKMSVAEMGLNREVIKKSFFQFQTR